MMRLVRRYTAATVIAVSAIALGGGRAPAHAADATGAFALHGVGAFTCGQLTESILRGETSVRQALASWILGYISAKNRDVPGTYDLTPVQMPEALTNIVVGVCQKNATLRVETATNTVFEALGSAKSVADSPELQISVGQQATTLRKDTLTAVQKALIAEKLLRGDADGTFGASTEAALRTFQKKQTLLETGLPDPPTVIRLLVELPLSAKAKAKAKAKK